MKPLPMKRAPYLGPDDRQFCDQTCCERDNKLNRRTTAHVQAKEVHLQEPGVQKGV